MKIVSIVLCAIMDVLQKILSVSAELFRQYGFKTITMDDIARRAGISKKTLYQHFVNKQEVVQASIQWYQNFISDECHAVLGSSENAVEGMVRLTQVLGNAFRQLNPLALLELQRFFPESHKAFRETLFGKDTAAIRDNILRGMEEGYYREDLNADLLALYRMESCLITLQPNLMVNERYTAQTVSQEIFEHFLYGIMNVKGEKLYKKYKEKYLKQL